MQRALIGYGCLKEVGDYLTFKIYPWRCDLSKLFVVCALIQIFMVAELKKKLKLVLKFESKLKFQNQFKK